MRLIILTLFMKLIILIKYVLVSFLWSLKLYTSLCFLFYSNCLYLCTLGTDVSRCSYTVYYSFNKTYLLLFIAYIVFIDVEGSLFKLLNNTPYKIRNLAFKMFRHFNASGDFIGSLLIKLNYLYFIFKCPHYVVTVQYFFLFSRILAGDT